MSGTDEAHEEGAHPALEATFLTIVYTHGTQAMIALGEIPNPITKSKHFDPRQAQWHIDSLDVLRDKTIGNLTDEERRALDNVLAEVKLKYLERTESI